MTSYNLANGIPCTVNPIIESVVVKNWGVDGIICTDAGGFVNLTGLQHYYENTTQSVAGTVNAKFNHYLAYIFSDQKPLNLKNHEKGKQNLDLPNNYIGFYAKSFK